MPLSRALPAGRQVSGYGEKGYFWINNEEIGI